jgi:nicotinic acid mononucleotide adenylyltransferase
MVRGVDPRNLRPRDLHSVLERLRSSDSPVLDIRTAITGRPSSVALLSGSFDPITVAHVALALAAGDHADPVVLTYSVRTLPKRAGAPLLTEDERLRTVEAVCAARPGLALGLCSHGLLGDQVAAAAERFPGAELSVVMGSDKLAQLFDPVWYTDRDRALAALFASAGVRYAVRDGDDVTEALATAAELGHGGRIEPLDVDPRVAAVSSRRVRQLARAGEDVAGLVPPEVSGTVVAAALRERR